MVVHVGRLDKTLNEATRNALEFASIDTLRVIKQSGRVPRKTSNLFRSIRYRMHGTTLRNLWSEIGSHLEYAAIHEYGGNIQRSQAFGRPTRPYIARYRERRYLRGGLQDSKASIGRIFDRTLQSAVDFR